MVFVTEQSGKEALWRKTHTMPGYRLQKVFVVWLSGIPVTTVDDLNTDLGPWMLLFTETLILSSICIRAFCTSLCWCLGK